MGSHQFDKQIKDKLQFHKSEVDPKLWDKIEVHLPVQEGSKRLPFWWIGSALFTGLAIWAGIIWYPSHAENSIKAPAGVSQKVTDQRVVSTPKVFAMDELSNVDKSIEAQNQDILPATPVNESKKSSAQAAGFNKATRNKINHDILVATTATSQPAQAVSATQESEGLADQITFPLAFHESQVKNYDFLEKNQVYPYSSKSKKVIIKDNCLADFNHGKKGVSLEAYFGNDFPIRTIDARSPEYDGLVQSRKESETPLYSYSLGARLGFNLSEHFKLMTGVHYSQINEKFEFVDPESSQTKIVKTTLYIKDGNGMIKDSTFSYDTIFIPGTLIYKIRNQYTMIDLPFLIGWKAFASEKMTIFVNAGVMANLSFRKEGMALVDDRYIVRNFDNMNPPAFNHSLGISTYFGAQFSYQWQSGFEFFLEPNVRIQHRGMTTKDYPVNQRYTTASILIGSKYNF